MIGSGQEAFLDSARDLSLCWVVSNTCVFGLKNVIEPDCSLVCMCYTLMKSAMKKSPCALSCHALLCLKPFSDFLLHPKEELNPLVRSSWL